MMKRHVLLSLLLAAAGSSFAQKLHAIYEFIPSAAATFREQVYFENGKKIAVRDSLPVDIAQHNADEDDFSESSIGTMVLKSVSNFRRIVIQQHGESGLTETRSLDGKNYLVSDPFPTLKWNTNYSDIDTLGSFVCHKATANYRGTTLVAYYTDAIPVPIGPNKFGGLPGLIVMLYNESANPNYWMLQEVKYPYSGSIPVDERYLSSLPTMSLKDYIQKEDKVVDEQMRILESKMPAGMEGETIERKKIRGTVEQIYEWEHEQASR